MPQWQEFSPVQWVIFGVVGYHLVYTILWIICKLIWGKRVSSWAGFMIYNSPLVIFGPFMEIFRNPGWRRKWLKRAGVDKGHVVLDEGFGMGLSSLVAARMVGPSGKVYALDNEPLLVLILWLRAKTR